MVPTLDTKLHYLHECSSYSRLCPLKGRSSLFFQVEIYLKGFLNGPKNEIYRKLILSTIIALTTWRWKILSKLTYQCCMWYNFFSCLDRKKDRHDKPAVTTLCMCIMYRVCAWWEKYRRFLELHFIYAALNFFAIFNLEARFFKMNHNNFFLNYKMM